MCSIALVRAPFVHWICSAIADLIQGGHSGIPIVTRSRAAPAEVAGRAPNPVSHPLDGPEHSVHLGPELAKFLQLPFQRGCGVGGTRFRKLSKHGVDEVVIVVLGIPSPMVLIMLFSVPIP